MTVQSEYEREEQEDYDHIDLWMFEHLGPRLFVGSLESEVGWRIASHIARNGRDHRAYLIAKTKECLASLALLGPDVYNVRVTDSSLQSFFLSPVASASTSRNTIHLSAYSEEEFFLNRQRTVLEEYYHVIEQWNTGVMNEVTYLGGLIEYGYDQHPDELAAKDFAGRNLGALQNCVGK